MAGEPKVIGLFDRQPVKVSPKEDELAEMRESAAAELDALAILHREGELNGFAIVFTYSDGGTGSVTGGDCEAVPIEYLGALDRLKHRINMQMDVDQGFFDVD